MECGCSSSYCHDYDSPELSETRCLEARMNHKCCECHRTIQKGEEYQRIRGKWEGEFSTFKTCKGCYRLREDMFCCSNLEELSEDVWSELEVDICRKDN